MTATVSITESNMMAALRGFLIAVLPAGVDVVQGQDNQVASPNGDFVIMTPILRNRLATNVDSWAHTLTVAALDETQATQVTIQLDVYGPASADNTQIISTVLRDGYAFDAFAASGFDVRPLYAGEPSQKPFLNAEGQYENRWGLDAVLQANPIVSVPQDFATVLTPASVAVDDEYAV